MQEHVKLPNHCEGFLFKPAGAPKGCVILFHERYGMVQHTIDVAKRLAESGYLTLAPDMFSLWEGDREALKRGDVRALVTDTDCAQQLDQWIAYLKTQAPGELAAKIALFGVCQSGRYPIVVASKRDDIAACVVFYGATSARDWQVNADQPIAMQDMIKGLKAPMLVVEAEQDHTISIDEMRRLRDAMEAADLSYRMKVVANMPHGFINDTMPGRYREVESEQAWTVLLTFLEDVFQRGWPHGRIVWDFVADKARDYDFTKNVRME